MKKAEVTLPDGLYQQVEGVAKKLHVAVPALLHRADRVDFISDQKLRALREKFARG